MTDEKKKMTAHGSSVGADDGQSISQNSKTTIPDPDEKSNFPQRDLEELYRKMRRMSDPAYLHSKATLEVVGRDQPDQRLYLSKDQESLVWGLDHAENELWKQPPDPVLEAVAKIVSADNREWEGSPTELAQAIQTDMAVNRLTKHLNVNASRLLEEHQVKYENKTKHAGRRIRLTYMVVEAPAFEVIE